MRTKHQRGSGGLSTYKKGCTTLNDFILNMNTLISIADRRHGDRRMANAAMAMFICSSWSGSRPSL
jgi:hypothetical protein